MLSAAPARREESPIDAIDGRHRPHVEIHRAQTRRGEVGRRGLFEQVQPVKQIARPLVLGPSLALAFENLLGDDVALADQRRDDASLFAHAARLGLDQRSRLARVQRKPQHVSAGSRHSARRVNRAEF